MKAERKAEIAKEAREFAKSAGVLIAVEPKITTSPDGYWVECWVKVPLSPQKVSGKK